MAHFVYRLSDGSYAGTRKATHPGAYTQRISRAETLEDARIFNTRSAASVAGRALDPTGSTLEVSILIKPQGCACEGYALCGYHRKHG